MENNKKAGDQLTTLAVFAREAGINKSQLQFYLKMNLLGEPCVVNEGSKVMLFNKKKLKENYDKILKAKKAGKKLKDI